MQCLPDQVLSRGSSALQFPERKIPKGPRGHLLFGGAAIGIISGEATWKDAEGCIAKTVTQHTQTA